MSKRSRLKWRRLVAISAAVAYHAELLPRPGDDAQTQCTSFAGTTGPSTHAGALAPASGGPVQCASPNGACPSLGDTSTQYQYDVVGFKNTSGSMQCYTVTLTNNNGGSSGMFWWTFGAGLPGRLRPKQFVYELCIRGYWLCSDHDYSIVLLQCSYGT